MKKIVLLAAIAGTASAAFAQNGGFRLTDGTAVYEVTSAGSSGTIATTAEPSGTSAQIQANFRVSGGTGGNDQLYANWWWYRVNTTGGASTRELGVRQTTGTAVRSSSAANNVNYTITTTASFSFGLSYTLTQIDANTAVINYSCTVFNNSGVAQDISLFNMADYFINNQDANDRLVTAFAGGGNRVMNLGDSANASIGMSHWGYGASGYGIGTFSGLSAQVTDSSIDNFNDVNAGAPVAPAAGDDISGLMQWNFTGVAAGGSATANAAIIVWTAAPTPGAAGLMGLGMLAAARRRRV